MELATNADECVIRKEVVGWIIKHRYANTDVATEFNFRNIVNALKLIFKMLFEMLKGKSLLVISFEDTLRIVVSLPIETQKDIARTVLANVLRAMYEFKHVVVPSEACNEIIKLQIERAKGMRHLAIKLGAKDEKDPLWAAAALIESWIFANSGIKGYKAIKYIHPILMGWINNILPEDEVDHFIQSA